MTITEFLLARIAEDEADVEGHAFDHAYQDTGVSVCRHGSHRASGWSAICWRATVGPRVLAECEAKRAIIDEFARVQAGDFSTWLSVYEPEFSAGVTDALRTVVRMIALSYADHPDYDEEWRPQP